jgi:hypothetical protein
LKATGLPVFSRQDLARAKTAVEVLTLAERHRPESARAGVPADAPPGRTEPGLSWADAVVPAFEGAAAEMEAHP